MPTNENQFESSSQKGFSLIELLAVIAIIAALSAILIPVVGAIRSSARKTKSLSNLRQIAAAMQMYSSDNKGFYPIGYYRAPSAEELKEMTTVPYGGNSPYRGVIFWYQQITPYLNQVVPLETSDSVLVSPFVDEGEFASNLSNARCNYSVHAVICPNVSYSNDHLMPVWNIGENPSEIILVGEATSTSFGIAKALFDHFEEWYVYGASGNDPDSPIPTDEPAGGALSYRANDHTLVAFLDGHTEAIRRGAVLYKNVNIRP